MELIVGVHTSISVLPTLENRRARESTMLTVHENSRVTLCLVHRRTLGCLSTLRMLRAAAPHSPRLRKLLQHVYEAIRLHRFINDIDVALCNGDFKPLCLLLGISNYAKFLGPSNESADHYSPESSSEAQAVLYQEPNLPDVEAYLHVEYAGVISKLEKKMTDDPEFPCCSCERLMQRKQVTAFKFSDSKFSLNMWRTLKDHISKGNSSAANDTHYVCSHCWV